MGLRNPNNSVATKQHTQVQLHGGKTPIVLYQEMKLQFELHVSIEPAASSLQRFNWSGPPPGTRNFSRNTWYMYQVLRTVEPLQGSCSRLNADVQLKLQLHFLVQNNGVFTTVKLHLSRVLEKQPLLQSARDMYCIYVYAHKSNDTIKIN